MPQQQSNSYIRAIKKIRGDWGNVNPVTKVIPNKKKVKSNKQKEKEKKEYENEY